MGDLESLSGWDNLIGVLKQRDFVNPLEFSEILGSFEKLNTNLEIAKSLGIPLFIDGTKISLQTKKDNLKSAIFCLVDIETTGFAPQKSRLIEIAAIKYQNGEVLERFESYVFAPKIPPLITHITGIDAAMLRGAPTTHQVLEKFKIFLSDCVFMAHNLDFDYNYINGKLAQCSLAPMKNRALCTLTLARKTIAAPRHGLDFLNEFLGLNHAVRHRAYADCLIALEVFKQSLANLEGEIHHIEDLIDLATPPKSKKKEKAKTKAKFISKIRREKPLTR